MAATVQEANHSNGADGEEDWYGDPPAAAPCNETGGGNGTNTSCAQDMYGGMGDYYPNPFNVTHVKVIFIFFYSVVFTCCCIGNILVILVVLKHRRMRTITNFFLANLAVADLCVGIFCVIPNLCMNLTPEWLFGTVMCKMFYFVQAMSYTASIIILTVISIERYFAIIYPIRSKQMTTMFLLRVTVVVVWVISAASGIPYLVIYGTHEIPTPNATYVYCMIKHQVNMKALATTNFILWYLLPLALMTVMYTRISIVLWESSRTDHAKKVGGIGSAPGGQKKKMLISFRSRPKIKGQQLVAMDSDDTSSAAELGGHSRSSGTGASAVKAADARHGGAGSAIEQQKLMENVDYNSQCESGGTPGGGTEPDAERDSPEESLSDVDYEDDWPDRRRQSDHIKLSKITFWRGSTSRGTGRKGSPKCPYKMNGAGKEAAGQAGRAAGLGKGSVRGKPLVKCSSTCGPRHKEPKRQDNRVLLARRRVIRLLIAVICSFALCVLPYHLRIMWITWTPHDPDLSFSQLLVGPITFVVYYFNSGLNPMLYAFLSERFRGSLVEVLTCRDRSQSRQTQMSFTRTMNSTVQ